MALVAMSVLSVRAEVKYLTTAEFKEKIVDYQKDSVWTYKGNKPVVIDFYTTWCGPCKRLAPIMEELSEKYKGKIEFYKVDTERERELAYVFNISSIPQVLYVPTKGKPQLTKGLYPKEEIEKIIDQFLLKKK
jgi:thioredoxin